MFTTSTLNELEIIEIKLIDHQFTLEEHLLVKKTLSMYTPGFWVPISFDIFSPDIQKQKRTSYLRTCQLFESYSSEWAFSSEEIDLIISALKHYVHLPLPLYGSLDDIRERKRERILAFLILTQLI